MSLTIDTPEGIQAYRYLSMYHMLKIQAKTGLRHSRGSVINVVKAEFPQIKGRTAKTVLRELDVILREMGVLSDSTPTA